jgi:hypothetical protein
MDHLYHCIAITDLAVPDLTLTSLEHSRNSTSIYKELTLVFGVSSYINYFRTHSCGLSSVTNFYVHSEETVLKNTVLLTPADS